MYLLIEAIRDLNINFIDFLDAFIEAAPPAKPKLIKEELTSNTIIETLIENNIEETKEEESTSNTIIETLTENNLKKSDSEKKECIPCKKKDQENID